MKRPDEISDLPRAADFVKTCTHVTPTPSSQIGNHPRGMRTCTAIFSLGLAALADARLAGRLATRAAAMRIASHDADERVRGPTMMVLGDLGNASISTKSGVR